MTLEGSSSSKFNLALCLSGGGFRATLFHLGVVRRLNELGVLSKLNVISSVSGGSILNGILATRWSLLTIDNNGVFSNFESAIATPVRRFCALDLRTPVLLGTRLKPKNWVPLARDYFAVSANYLAQHYHRLYEEKSLSDVPTPGPNIPRFVFCSTNVRTGACWHFHAGAQGRMGDFYTGYCDAGQVKVGEAVAASSAFTPGFGALRLEIPKNFELTRVDPWGRERPVSAKRAGELIGNGRKEPLLTDGGVYDNLGVEPVWDRYSLLVSDAGAPFATVSASSQFLITRLERAANISLEQVGAVRKRWLVGDLIAGRQKGALWTISTLIDDFELPDAQGYSAPVRPLLQKIRTDLNAFTEGEIACLENHGYSLADAATRSRIPTICGKSAMPFTWPHPEWVDETKACVALSESEHRNIARDIGRFLLSKIPRLRRRRLRERG